MPITHSIFFVVCVIGSAMRKLNIGAASQLFGTESALQLLGSILRSQGGTGAEEGVPSPGPGWAAPGEPKFALLSYSAVVLRNQDDQNGRLSLLLSNVDLPC